MTQLPLFTGSDLITPQAAARQSDPATSHLAAKEVESRGTASAHRRIIAEAVRKYPGLTAGELPAKCGLAHSQVHKRMKEIETLGLICRGADRVCTASECGSKRKTWWPVGGGAMTLRPPDYEREGVRLWCDDCRDILPHLSGVDAVVTDPPYGILNLQGDGSTPCVRKSRRQVGSGTLKNRILNQANVEWDATPPTRETLTRLRAASKWQVIWGGNYFELPPCRAVLVWDKEQPWENFSQVELAWTNLTCPAGLFRLSACRGVPGKTHPTQKPLDLMLWCLDKVGDEVNEILDPFMGSGTTGVACIRTGRKFIGIEKERKYFDIAVKRIEAEFDRAPLFAAQNETQSTFLGDAP